MQERIAELIKRPFMRQGQCDHQAYSPIFDNWAKCFTIFEPLKLCKTMCHIMYFILLNRSINQTFNFEYPFVVNQVSVKTFRN